jgi:hypothetical protein
MNHYRCEETSLTTGNPPVEDGSQFSKYTSYLFRQIFTFMHMRFFCALLLIGSGLSAFSSHVGYLHAYAIIQAGDQSMFFRLMAP